MRHGPRRASRQTQAWGTGNHSPPVVLRQDRRGKLRWSRPCRRSPGGLNIPDLQENGRKGTGQNLEIQKQGFILNVGEIQLHHFIKGGPVFSFHLPEARQTGQRPAALAVPRLKHLFQFVAVNRGKNPNPNWHATALGTDEEVSGEYVGFAVHCKTGVAIDDNVWRIGGNPLHWRQQLGDGAPARRSRTFRLRYRCGPNRTQRIPHKLKLFSGWEPPGDRSESVIIRLDVISAGALFWCVKAQLFDSFDLDNMRIANRDLHRPKPQRTNLLAHQLQPSRQILRHLVLRPFHFISCDNVHLNDAMIQYISTMSIDNIIFIINCCKILSINTLRDFSH